MSLSSRGKSGPVISSQSPTAVLLVCIYDSLVVDITPELIRSRFGKYAPISKVLIFERGEVTKLFLQLPTPQIACEAKTELDGSKLLESICKMSIYFSGLEKLEMREEQSSPTRTNFVSEYDLLTKSSPDSDSEGFNDLLMHSFTAFSPFARSKTDNPQQLAREILETQSKREQTAEESPFDFEIRSSIDSLLNSHSNSSASDQTPAQMPQKTGTILAFEAGRKVQIRHIYNLFSNFGNIAGISKKKAGAFVKFRSSQFASMAEAYLSGQWLLGNELKLRRTEQSDFLPKENEFCELVFFDSSFDRFTPHKSITVNAPSRTIHVSSLRKQLCKEQTLRNIFQQHGKVEALQLIRSSDRNMALVRFATLQDSFSAVAQLHNALYSGRKMQISFTKSRI